ncbi:MAG: hypothetical protein ACLVEO_03350 [Lachnospiraceae bacterium]
MLNQLDTHQCGAVDPHLPDQERVPRGRCSSRVPPKEELLKNAPKEKDGQYPCSKDHRLGGDGYENTGTFRRRSWQRR